MNRNAKLMRTPMALVVALAVSTTAVQAPVSAQGAKVARSASQMPIAAQRTSRGGAADLNMSVGRGQLINLSGPISDVFVSNEAVADVQVRSATQIYILAKAAGESTIYATSSSGAVVYSANIRAGTNVSSIDSMLQLAMPEATIQATPMNGMVLLTGTVAGPDDSAEAARLVQAYVGEGVRVVSRLRTATPLQVNLQVKIAEVSRSYAKEIGSNLITRDATGGFTFGVAQGRNFGSIGTQDLSAFPKLDASNVFGLPPGTLSLPFDPRSGQFITQGGTVVDFKNLAQGAGKTTFGLAGRLLGVDLATALDLAETDGLLTTLAQPNLTALSGETASFLAGGEIPIPMAATLGAVEIEYKPYGVSLAFTPTVLSDGRISMRVRPEVSELSKEGSIKINGFDVPGISTRRAETTIELGSGQSFMIGGLMRSLTTNAVTKAPGAGDVPILGALFRSSAFRRADTELMIIVTPYLVKPTSAKDIVLPTDGYKAPTDLETLLLGKSFGGKTGEKRPGPTAAPDRTVAQPQVGAATQVVPAPAAEVPSRRRRSMSSDVKPGFGL